MAIAAWASYIHVSKKEESRIMKLTKFTASHATQPKTTIGLLVIIANFVSFVMLSQLRNRSSFNQYQHHTQNFESNRTSTKFLLPLARMGHLIFNAISLKALAMFRPRAILIPVVMPLYHLFSLSPIALFLNHNTVTKTYPPQRAAVINHRAELPIKMCLNCFPV